MTTIIIFAILIFAYLAYRYIQSTRVRFSINRLVNQLKDNPEQGLAFVESLDVVVQKRPIQNQDNFDELPEMIGANGQYVGDFLVKYIQRISENQLLFITDFNYSESLSFVPIPEAEAIKAYNLNFVLNRDAQKFEYLILSDLHSDLNDKNLRTDFANALLNYLESVEEN